jgi:hypothetical protein
LSWKSERIKNFFGGSFAKKSRMFLRNQKKGPPGTSVTVVVVVDGIRLKHTHTHTLHTHTHTSTAHNTRSSTILTGIRYRGQSRLSLTHTHTHTQHSNSLLNPHGQVMLLLLSVKNVETQGETTEK